MLLSKKLALAAVLISVASIGIARFASLQLSSSALAKKTVEKIEAVADGRRNQLETYLANVELDISSLAQGALATNAASARGDARLYEREGLVPLREEPHPRSGHPVTYYEWNGP